MSATANLCSLTIKDFLFYLIVHCSWKIWAYKVRKGRTLVTEQAVIDSNYNNLQQNDGCQDSTPPSSEHKVFCVHQSYNTSNIPEHSMECFA